MEREEIVEDVTGYKVIDTSGFFVKHHIEIPELIEWLEDVKLKGATHLYFDATNDGDYGIEDVNISPVKVSLESEEQATDRIKKKELEAEGYAKEKEEAQKTEYLRLKTIYENK